MKVKRMVAIAIIMIMSTLVGGASVFASASKRISSKYSDVNLYGYIDFVEGPYWITDKVWYSASISGVDVSSIPHSSDPSENSGGKMVYVIPGTDENSLNPVYLDDCHRMRSGSKISCGYGGSYGKLAMFCVDTTETVKSYP
ncbi:MAG: hypothetical protein IJA10_00160 [Lachnospiraceae bacterium]|nr:hypothetical protein [Lachnospiraceae bacterium]